MRFLIRFLLMISIISVPVIAEEISYDYIDTSIWMQELSGITPIEVYKGISMTFSKSLSKHIHVLGLIIVSEQKNEDAFDSKSIGFGAHYSINKSTDIVLIYSHLKYHYIYRKAPYLEFRAFKGGRFNSIDAKILHQFSDDIEMSVGLIRDDEATLNLLYKGYSVGAKYRINNNLSLRFEMGGLKDSKSTISADKDFSKIGIRYNF